jgi:pimeloyl-ACP methyl ester carboxylesterase
VSGRLVFIPGFLDDATLWRGVIERLALPGWELVPVNLRGTGRAEPRRGATLEAYRDQVLEVLDELERESARPTVVVGHSMGAQVAELVAGCRPHIVVGLVLITPIPLKGFRYRPNRLSGSPTQRAAEIPQLPPRAGSRYWSMTHPTSSTHWSGPPWRPRPRPRWKPCAPGRPATRWAADPPS